jgi:hypothetical protein
MIEQEFTLKIYILLFSYKYNMETKPLEFKPIDFYLPAIGIITASERNPVETIDYSSKKMYVQATLFSIYHTAYISAICFATIKGLEALTK